MKKNPRLENWFLYGGSLRGQVYGNRKFKDGEWILTSKLKVLDFEKGTALTQNTLYDLGEQDDDLPTILAQAQE